MGDINSRVWFGIAPQLAAETELGTTFTDCFIRNIFPSKRNVVPWHSRPVVIAGKPKTPYAKIRSNLISEDPVSAVYYDRAETDPVYDVVQVANTIELQPYTQHHVLINTDLPVSILKNKPTSVA